ncbi:hypothetical protein H696_02327 [Fonticula alba]|uniref:Uncharacterized protein n=1 Tax=Fonticula alba TaxID=691883 RepID=A0A058ZBS0_FONAL|nr:hypothetical protein H696_02327 [Fonticula alba]KCV71376.1 hypothetical protein H696_02327 [Fonticula alba]|eukprot:XP_009494499.1 hypothetical protein H696_02327 [Fonticula alba]
MARSPIYSLLLVIFALVAMAASARSDEAQASVTIDDSETIVLGNKEIPTDPEEMKALIDNLAKAAASDSPLPAPPALNIKHILPDAPFNAFASNDFANVLIGLENAGSKAYQIHSIGANLHSPKSYATVSKELDTYKYDMSIAPGEQATVHYRWFLPSVFQPIDHILTVEVSFSDEAGQLYTLPAFNQTVSFVEPTSHSAFDLQSLSIYALILAAIGGVAYYFTKDNLKKAPKETSPVVTAPVAPKVDADWVPAAARSHANKTAAGKASRK